MRNEEFSIWSPYQILYIESLYTVTYTAVNYINTFSIINNEIIDGNNEHEDRLIDCLQNIITQAAALSKYFWPIRDKNSYTKNRGLFLRTVFEITNSNPLSERNVRDAIEHFDERLDKLTSRPVIGIIYPLFIGKKPISNGIPLTIFRAYYIDEQIFEVLGEKFHVLPIIAEICRIHNLVLQYKELGTFL